jgi:hypothetical protein
MDRGGIIMGILSKEALEQVYNHIRDFNMVRFLAKKENASIMMDLYTNTVYYYTDREISNCYKKQTREEYIKDRDELVKQGWKLL